MEDDLKEKSIHELLRDANAIAIQLPQKLSVQLLDILEEIYYRFMSY